MSLSSPESQRTPVEPSSRVAGGRAFARMVKLTFAAGAVTALGVFALVARATHPGGVRHASTLPALSALTAPKSFVNALATGLAPGSVGPAAGPAQAVSGGS
jgi:hypothetical protein